MRLVYSSLFDSVLVRCGFDYLFQFVHLCEALRMNDFRVERTQHFNPLKTNRNIATKNRSISCTHTMTCICQLYSSFEGFFVALLFMHMQEKTTIFFSVQIQTWKFSIFFFWFCYSFIKFGFLLWKLW